MDVETLISLNHPANNPDYRKLFEKYVKDTKCLFCKILNLIDEDHKVMEGVHMIIPWYLCIHHISDDTLLYRKIKKFAKCVNKENQFSNNNYLNISEIGMDAERYEHYDNYIHGKYKKHKRDPVLLELETLKRGKTGKKNQRLINDALKMSIDDLNILIQSRGRVVGNEKSFQNYINYKLGDLISKNIKRQKTSDDIIELRKISRYLLLSVEMMKLSDIWGENVELFPKQKDIPIDKRISYISVMNEANVQGCEDDCIWVNGVKYPCVDGFCIEYVRKTKNVYLLNTEAYNIVIVKKSDPEIQEQLEELDLCGQRSYDTSLEFKVDGIYYLVDNTNIRPIKEYFRMGIYKPKCNADEYNIRLKWILNQHFWKFVKPLIEITKHLDIELTVNNVWSDLENFYVWGAKKGNKIPFENFMNIKPNEREILLSLIKNNE